MASKKEKAAKPKKEKAPKAPKEKNKEEGIYRYA